MKRVLVCVGTRPNLIKVTQLERAFREYPDIDYRLLHTGQHSDANMRDVFFRELGVRAPDISLTVHQGTQTAVVSQIMVAFEEALSEYPADLVMVPGDVNSSFACAFVACRHRIPLAHIESGLRSFDKAMPEEVNRILIDDMSELMFVTEPSGSANLLREGKDETRMRYVGNSMIDALIAFLPLIEKSSINEQLKADDYYLVTFHRPANVDTPARLNVIAQLLSEIAQRRKVIFPMHPRTKARFREFGLEHVLQHDNIVVTSPLGYIDFMSLVKGSRAVLTDSGGVQEETTFLGIPCITLRRSTERPVTVDEGTNSLCKPDKKAVGAILASIDAGTYKKGAIPKLWDGRSSERIAQHVNEFLLGR